MPGIRFLKPTQFRLFAGRYLASGVAREFWSNQSFKFYTGRLASIEWHSKWIGWIERIIRAGKIDWN